MFLFTVLSTVTPPLPQRCLSLPSGADVTQDLVFVQLFPTHASSEAEMIKVHLPGKIQSRWDANDAALFPKHTLMKRAVRLLENFSLILYELYRSPGITAVNSLEEGKDPCLA